MDNEPPAAIFASSWMLDARLVALGTASEEGISATGEAEEWAFSYYSPSNDLARRFTLAFLSLIAEEDVDPDSLRSLDPLPENWIDSPVLVEMAERSSNNFRDQHSDAVVTAFLSRGQRDDPPERPLWRITFSSAQDDTTLTFDYDAETGLLVQTHVEEEPGVPSTFVLGQNYPNPFNATTRIPFGLARSGPVTLAVYNVLGQRVATLVDEILPAGTYTFTWQPDHLPSGVYLYQLKTNQMLLSRVMTRRK